MGELLDLMILIHSLQGSFTMHTFSFPVPLSAALCFHVNSRWYYETIQKPSCLKEGKAPSQAS
jgi:hypothetical protein